ncbi:MAG: hypothetical protein ACNI3A_03685 [Desulfovibrio sp.]|uniref:hypothetical protein n=1 Tax=Desulfovibrio sp. 7SRBS1 TaxID=3378064 RepID=UPI003B405B00
MAFSSGDILLAANMAPLAFNVFLAMTALGIPLVALVCEILAASKGKVFYKKTAQQLSTFGLGCMAYTLFVVAGTLILIYLKIPGLLPFGTPVNVPLIWACIPLALWVVASITHAITWKKLKTSQALHILIGVVAALAGLCVVYVSVALTYAYMLPLPGERVQPETLIALLAPTEAPIFPALAVSMLALAPLATTALGLGYMLYRRKRDDWGRDYYVFSLRLVSTMAAFFGVLFLALQIWVGMSIHTVFGQLVAVQNIAPAWYAGMGTGLASIVLWAAVSRSSMPMRLSGFIILAGFFEWSMLTCLGFAGLKLFFLY